MEQDKVIAILDSGVGGLTVLSEVMRQLPNETVYYFGDTLRCPYGPRSSDEVKRFTMEIIHFLLQFPLKAIVIACNTATAFALAEVKKRFSIPVLGVIEPGARAAIKATSTNRIGVIGTQGTIKSGAYERVLKRIDPKIRVLSLACPRLAPLVEEGITQNVTIKKIIEEELLPFQSLEMDTLILGCTHYPILQDEISSVIGEKVSLISSAKETAEELSSVLHHHDLLYEKKAGSHRFFTTGECQSFMDIAEKWLNQQVKVETIVLKRNVS